MKIHELFYALALEAQRFDLDFAPDALPIVQFGLEAVQKAKTPEQFLVAMAAVYSPPPVPSDPVERS